MSLLSLVLLFGVSTMSLTATAWTLVPTLTTTTRTRTIPLQKQQQQQQPKQQQQYNKPHHQNHGIATMTTQRSMSSISTTSSETKDNKDDSNDWEYVEFDRLSESDLVGSEWLIGTCWDNRPNVIDETWCRLITNAKDGTNVAVWGDDSQGKWSLDVATQYVTISKTRPWGKQIWACLVEDYYYMRGTVRGWSFWAAAAVEGQWQARRLGVDPEEAGVAPWFANEGDDDGDDAAAADDDDANARGDE